MGHEDDRRIALVDRLTERFGVEAGDRDPEAAIPWPNLPTVRSLTVHVGTVHRWATSIVTGGEWVPEADTSPDGDLRAWYAEGRDALLDALRTTPPETPCWIIGGREGTVAFWVRRMVSENVKHLIDVRAAGGGEWRVAPELSPADYADGVDELFDVFLRRSRPSLPRLPAEVVLRASDVDRGWIVTTDWQVVADRGSAGSATLRARAGDLALVVWERADPLDDTRFAAGGDRGALRAFCTAPIHPW